MLSVAEPGFKIKTLFSVIGSQKVCDYLSIEILESAMHKIILHLCQKTRARIA